MGADERIFKNLDMRNYELVPVPWLPFRDDDDIRSYARRLSEQIHGENPIILGLSLGGMLAVEIGKVRATEKIFLVSSAKTSSELPVFSKIPKAEMLIDLIPRFLFTKSSYIGSRLAGAKNADDWSIISEMREDVPAGFMKRALKIVVAWNNNVHPRNVIHIHGTKDMIIPSSNVRPDHWIKGGTHIMIYNRAQEVSKIISDCLSK